MKLKYIDEMNMHRRAIAVLYDTKISSDALKPIYQDDNTHVYHIYNLRVERRDDLKEYLHSEGIGIDIHYPISPTSQLALNNHITIRYPISDKIHETTISLLISTATDLKAAKTVSESINHWSK